jgi:hypothetical protein
MQLQVSRRPAGARFVAVFVSAVLFLACKAEDPRVKAVESGATRDDAIKAIVGDAPVNARDTFPHIHRRSLYLINKKEMEVLWFTPTDQMPGKDTLPFRELTPIVLYDGQVIGKGWDFWDSTAKVNNIAVPPKDTAK